MKPAKYLVEFVGTLFLVFTIGMVAVGPGGAGAMAPLAIGAALMVMVYAGGHISGAHYNPAVTLAVTIRGKCAPGDVVPYVLSQCVAAAAAGLLVLFLKGSPKIEAMSPVMLHAILAEALFTFALCYVVLNVATAKATEGNSYFGLAIAGTVVAGAFAVGGISGGAFNPAVVVGLCVMGALKWADAWMHLSGEVAGAVLAAGVFKATHRE